MTSTSNALIISDFPIVAATAQAVFGVQFRVLHRTWSSYGWDPVEEAELVIVDVTTVAPESALALVAGQLPMARIVAFSLHRNDVQVYRMGSDGLMTEGNFPSLLTLAA